MHWKAFKPTRVGKNYSLEQEICFKTLNKLIVTDVHQLTCYTESIKWAILRDECISRNKRFSNFCDSFTQIKTCDNKLVTEAGLRVLFTKAVLELRKRQFTLGIFDIFLTTPPVYGHARKVYWVVHRIIPQWTLKRSGAKLWLPRGLFCPPFAKQQGKL